MQPATQNETLLMIEGQAGQLEALIGKPNNQHSDNRKTAIICHPHPLHGGNMHNKVVYTLKKSLANIAHTIRFNYRGVGQSDGTYDAGRGETRDLLAMIDWVKTNRTDHDLYLAGFSFGCYIILYANKYCEPKNIAIKQLIAVAPAVNHFNFTNLAPLPPHPLLIIHGEYDEIADYKASKAWATTLDETHTTFVTVKAGKHFFHRRLTELASIIAKHCQ